MKLRRLTQPSATGCGLACVAMVTGKKHGEIKKQAIELKLFAPDGPFRAFSRDIQLLLKTNDLQSLRGRKVKSWTKLPDLAFAGVNPRTNIMNGIG